MQDEDQDDFGNDAFDGELMPLQLDDDEILFNVSGKKSSIQLCDGNSPFNTTDTTKVVADAVTDSNIAGGSSGFRTPGKSMSPVPNAEEQGEKFIVKASEALSSGSSVDVDGMTRIMSATGMTHVPSAQPQQQQRQNPISTPQPQQRILDETIAAFDPLIPIPTDWMMSFNSPSSNIAPSRSSNSSSASTNVNALTTISSATPAMMPPATPVNGMSLLDIINVVATPNSVLKYSEKDIERLKQDWKLKVYSNPFTNRK